MTTYKGLHWESIRFLKDHLYRRIASPLNNALGRLAIAQHVEGADVAQEQYRHVARSLEITLNLVKAWAALIHVESGGVIQDSQRRPLLPDALPEWLVEHLNSQTAFRAEHSQPVFAHPETFYESLILVCEIVARVGSLKCLALSNAPGETPGVWLRAVFQPPESGPYASLNKLIADLDQENPLERDTAIQLQVMAGFMRINRAHFTLQNNTQTGEQALAARLPTTHIAGQPAAPAPAVEIITPPNGNETKGQKDLYESVKHGLEDAPPDARSSLTQLVRVQLDDQAPKAEPDRDTAGQEATSGPMGETEDKPILSGPVLARTPRDLEPPDALSPDQAEADDPSKHTISGPVLAPRSQRAPSAPLVPSESERAAPAPDDPGEVENASETLIVPPPDFRQRFELALSSGEPPSTGETSSADGVPDQPVTDTDNGGDDGNDSAAGAPNAHTSTG
jgi:hypothetical protein